MDIKRRLKKILGEIRQMESLTAKAETEIRGDNIRKARDTIDILNVLTVNEMQEIEDLVKNLKYDDPELTNMIGELTRILNELKREIQFLLRQTDSGVVDEGKKAQLISVLETMKSLEKREEELDQAFFGMKATKFEEVLDVSAIPKLPRNTKERIIATRGIQQANMALSDIAKAEKFQRVVDQLGGPERAMKIYKKGFSLINAADRLVRKLGRANPKNALIQESGSYELDEDGRSVSAKGINVPYPNVGFPGGNDFAFIITYGMIFSAFTASLMGGIWVAALGGILALIVVTGVGSWLIARKYTRYVLIGKRAINLIAFMSQGGNVRDIYNVENMIPEGGPARVRSRKAA